MADNPEAWATGQKVRNALIEGAGTAKEALGKGANFFKGLVSKSPTPAAEVPAAPAGPAEPIRAQPQVAAAEPAALPKPPVHQTVPGKPAFSASDYAQAARETAGAGGGAG